MSDNKAAPKLDELIAPPLTANAVVPNPLAPIIFFDGVTSHGSHDGVVQLHLEVGRFVQGADGRLICERREVVELRCTVAGLRQLHHSAESLLLAAASVPGEGRPN